MKKISSIFALLLCFCLNNTLVAQSGGRKREHKNQRRGGSSVFKKGHSSGHADRFAHGGSRRGVFARLFRKDRPAWVYHSTNSGKAQKRETRHLFARYRTKGKRYKDGILAKLNADRAKRRNRGNNTFRYPKYR